MLYNVFISNFWGPYNILELDETKLQIIVKAYKKGEESFTIRGTKYFFSDSLHEFKIFTYETKMINLETVKQNGFRFGNSGRDMLGKFYFLPKGLSELGKEVTDNFIGDEPFGGNSEPNLLGQDYVHATRIEELKKVKSANFDLTKLIKLCEELNSSSTHGNYFSVGAMVRAILDHVPPLFGLKTFSEVANNYNSSGAVKSFKDSMQQLENSMRKITDRFLHSTITKSESLPNDIQVNCKRELDVLLGEVVRILK